MAKETDKYTRGGIKFEGYNKPKKTPGANKKMAVLAKEGDTIKLVRFGGIKGKDSKLSANYWSRRAWDC